MHEFLPGEAYERKTGINDANCLVFGNGVVIEKIVFAKCPLEKQITAADGRTSFNLIRRMGNAAKGDDIVQIHFTPKTSLAEQAHSLDQVAPEEKKQMKVDAMFGFLSLAHFLLQKDDFIAEHKPDTDFYLMAMTENPGFALFLVQNCGFRGSARTGTVWMKRYEFTSNENITKMLAIYKRFQDEATQNKQQVS